MSSEKKTFRVPGDSYRELAALSDELGLNEHKTGIRCLERGLAAYGYGPGDVESEPWVGPLLVETAKALAYVAVSLFAISTVATPATAQFALWMAGGLLVGAVLALLAERHAVVVDEVLGLPARPPWETQSPAGGDEE
jgi:hypothetical protein